MTKKKLTAYLAGGMSNYPNHNFPAFDKYKRLLEEDTEYSVISPADLDRELGYDGSGPIVTGTDLREVLTFDITHLMTCDAIFLMPSWRTSSGARVEAHVAAALGLTLIEVSLLTDEKLRLVCIEAEEVPGHVLQNVG